MPRQLTNGMLTALQATNLNPAIFVEATFASQTVYLWSGVGSVTWNSQTWIGLGAFLGFSTPEDSSAVEAKGITITLSGLDATLLPAAMNDFKLGLPVMIYFGLYDADGVLINNPVIAWAGRMDQPTIDVDGETATISINCENRLIDMNIAVDRRYTNADCQRDYPGDLGFMFVDSIQQLTLFWGQFPSSSNNI